MTQFGLVLSVARSAGVIGAEHAFFEAGGGCARCNGSGYAGRLGIFEHRDVRGQVADLLVLERARFNPRAAERIVAAALAAGDAGARDLRGDGMLKAAMGLTTPEEVFAATMQETTAT
jgi:type II secretory ATPase GspE/PulE/Tfp pilus assembly ATPase PilB-like protein